MSDIEEIAQRLGMKQSEVTNVVPVADGVLVQTHDGQWTLIRDDGELVFRVDPPVDSDDVIRESLEDLVDLAEEIAEAAAPANGGIVKGRPVLVGENDPEEVVVPEGATVKPAPKRRSSR